MGMQVCVCVCVPERLKLDIVYVMNGTEHCVFVRDVSQTLFSHIFPASTVTEVSPKHYRIVFVRPKVMAWAHLCISR